MMKSSDLPALTFFALLVYALACVTMLFVSLAAALIVWLVGPVVLAGVLWLAYRKQPDLPLTVEELVAVGVDWNYADSIRPG